MNRPLRQLISVQMKEFFREPEVLFWSFAFPILLAWLLGITFNVSGVQKRRVALIGPAASHRALAARTATLAGQRQGEFTFTWATTDEALLLLKKGIVSLYIEEEREGQLAFHYDPRNSSARLDHLLLERELAPAAGGEAAVRPLTLQGTRYIDFLLPGLLAMGIMNSALWGVGWSLVEIRMKKFLRIMAATPMSKTTFLYSRLLARLVLSVLEFLLIYLFALVYFRIHIQGSLAALLLIFMAGNVAFFGIAVCLSSRTSNTQVANGLINAVNLPMMLLSGIFFSYHNFPPWAERIVKWLPLTLLADSTRAIFNEGAGILAVFVPCLVLTALGILFFYFGLKIYKWY